MTRADLFVAALALLGCIACTDEGIVGSRQAALCEPSCEGEAVCHPDLELCVQCVSDTDCAGSSDGRLCDRESNVCRACDAGDSCTEPDCEELDDRFDEDCDLDEGDDSIDDDDDDDPTP